MIVSQIDLYDTIQALSLEFSNLDDAGRIADQLAARGSSGPFRIIKPVSSTDPCYLVLGEYAEPPECPYRIIKTSIPGGQIITHDPETPK